jgi:hypothetical protein
MMEDTGSTLSGRETTPIEADVRTGIASEGIHSLTLGASRIKAPMREYTPTLLRVGHG